MRSSPRKRLNLYWIGQDENQKEGAYREAVVVARSEAEARKIHPSGECEWKQGKWVCKNSTKLIHPWASCPEEVDIIYLGKAGFHIKQGSIVAK